MFLRLSLLSTVRFRLLLGGYIKKRYQEYLLVVMVLLLFYPLTKYFNTAYGTNVQMGKLLLTGPM